MFNFKNGENTAVRFKRKTSNFQNNKGNGSFQQFPVDRILEVLEVHPAKNGEGYLIAKDVDNNKKFHVTIKPEIYQKQKDNSNYNNAQNIQNIFGWLIDEKYEAATRQSKYFIATRTEFYKKREVLNDEEVFFIHADWIYHPETYDPNKLFTTILTAWAPRPYTDEYSKSYQSWKQEDVIAIDGSEESGVLLEKAQEEFNRIEAELKAVREEVEKAREEGRKPKVSYPIQKGFQVRALKVSDKLDDKGEPIINEEGKVVKDNVIVERYFPLLKEEPEQDAGGNIIKPAKDISGDYFIEFLTEFASHAYETYTEQEEGTYNLDEEKGDVVLPKDVLVEVVIFSNYLCNNLGKDNRLNNPNGEKPKYPTPLQRMTQKLSKPAADASEVDYYQGMNLAVKGVLDLSQDTVDIQSRQFITRNTAKRAFISGQKKDVHYFLKSTNGFPVRISDELRTKEELEAMKNGYNVKPVDNDVASENQVYDEISDDILI